VLMYSYGIAPMGRAGAMVAQNAFDVSRPAAWACISQGREHCELVMKSMPAYTRSL